MCFLQLPLRTILDTLEEIVNEPTIMPQLPDTELYLIIKGVQSKQKVVQQSIVNVAVKGEKMKLKEINLLYKDVDDSYIKNATNK
jgi:archaellum component FlaG (FlaF/FlaG flagellin family)